MKTTLILGTVAAALLVAAVAVGANPPIVGTPVAVVIQQGTLTVWDKTVGNCAPFTVSKGQSFVEPANHVHRAMNEGSQTVKLYAVFLGIPKGAVPQKTAQAPAGCAA
jgi:hypothetical protein